MALASPPPVLNAPACRRDCCAIWAAKAAGATVPAARAPQRRRQQGHSRLHSAASELSAQFIQGAFNAHAGGVFTQPQDGANFPVAFFLKKAQQHGVAFGFTQPVYGFIECRAQLHPAIIRFPGRGFIHDTGILFAPLPALLTANGFDCRVIGAGVQPARQGRMPAQFLGLPGQVGKYRLSDIFGETRIAIGQPDGSRVN